MPKEIDITDKSEFSYFITTPCEEWDEEWCASKHPVNKTTITLAIMHQLEWLMKEGSEEEKKEANRMFKQFKVNHEGIRSARVWNTFRPVSTEEGVKAGGYIDDFWIKMDLERKINLQEIKVSAEVRKVQNKRSLDVLKETVVEHNEASALLADFARDGHDVRKRRKQYYQLDGYTTPSPGSPMIHPLEGENPFVEEEEDKDIIFDDIPCEFSFKNGDPVDDLHDLFMESNVQEMLSLSSILLLASNSYSNTMIDHFGLSLLDEIHQKFKSEQQIVLDSNSETTFRKWQWVDRVMMLLSGYAENFQIRKAEGRAKQPDFTTSIICQLQTSAILYVGEVSSSSKRGDVYKNCNDLILLGVFMKDILYSSVYKGANIKVLGFQYYKVDHYTMDLVQGIYIMIYIGQMLVLASLKDMSSFVDDIELSLKVQDMFLKSYEIFIPNSVIRDH
ncbi:4379_t:CDS:2 [Cetraspora pellucida]|uniref:4379_t:CDS:1 n=1 Tax=Cetraspora pellucida TaxID=1433469 RepID=A0ACA9LSK3_9GLOM|nr:4379_t:CDS:2 [Cetraspora pellucida]